jgi:hypothetical protein
MGTEPPERPDARYERIRRTIGDNTSSGVDADAHAAAIVEVIRRASERHLVTDLVVATRRVRLPGQSR